MTRMCTEKYIYIAPPLSLEWYEICMQHRAPDYNARQALLGDDKGCPIKIFVLLLPY